VRIERSRLDRGTERWRALAGDGTEAAFAQVVAGWSGAADFRDLWRASLGVLPFDAYCWECPPLTAAGRSRPFECVFVASPLLARMPPDPAAFSGHFRADRSVVTFRNLGGDAVLVAPAPGGPGTNYSHLASFTATAPAAQQDALWQSVGAAMEKRIGASPVWLSTAGLGVAWLHVRLDDRPKYYRHAPYRRA
jgi:Family of unknown function (DUF6940)